MGNQASQRSLNNIDIIDQDKGAGATPAFGAAQYEFYQQYKDKIMSKPRNSLNYYKNLERSRSRHEQEQKARERHNYKYFVFMMMRHDLLKTIKNEKMDQKYIKLKMIMRIRRLIILAKLIKILSHFFE